MWHATVHNSIHILLSSTESCNWQATTDAFCKANQIWFNTYALGCPRYTSSQTCLYLIKNQANVVLIAKLANPAKVTLIRKDDGKIFNNWLHHDSSNAVATFLEQLFQSIGIVVGNRVDLSCLYLKWHVRNWLVCWSNILKFWLYRNLKRVIAAVESAFNFDQSLFASNRLGDSHGIHRRFSSRVCESNHV